MVTQVPGRGEGSGGQKGGGGGRGFQMRHDGVSGNGAAHKAKLAVFTSWECDKGEVSEFVENCQCRNLNPASAPACRGVV